MATITLRVSDELKETMDKLEKINWSSVMRELLEEEVKRQWIDEQRRISLKEYRQGNYFSSEQVHEMIKGWKKEK